MAATPDDLPGRIDRDGFAPVAGLLDAEALDHLGRALARLDEAPPEDPAGRRRSGTIYGQRDLLGRLPEVAELAASRALLDLVEPVVGPGAFAVRGLLFDKNPAVNWGVPWHRDLMIAVAARAEATGYSGWSVKAGILHVQPPVSVLEGMLTVRIHLDDAGPSNAALRVLPGSHRLGGADPTEIEPWRERVEPVTCSARAGDALVMRPLLIHASSPSTTPSRRRVVHLEYAAGGLPGGVEWHESARRMAVGRP